MAPAKRVSRVNEHYPELDAHRGIAVFAVVLFHVFQFCNVDHYLYFGTPAYTVLNSLDAAIPWFFVLSAFLLFKPVCRSIIDATPPTAARTFLGRRSVRLLPAYAVAVAVVWFLRQESLPGDWRDLLEHLTFTQTFDTKRIFYTLGPAWSLSVAVFSYVVAVVLIVLLARICRRIPTRRGRTAVLVAGIAGLGSVSLLWKLWSFAGADRPTLGSFTTWFGPMANLDMVAIGMGVAVLVVAFDNARPLAPRRRLALRLGGLTILVIAFMVRRPETWTGVYFSFICSVGFSFLVAAAVLGPPRDRWARAVSLRPLRWLGTISFGIYLWHEPIMLALRGPTGLVRQRPDAFVNDAIVVLLASVVLGWLSYVLIERPSSQLAG